MWGCQIDAEYGIVSFASIAALVFKLHTEKDRLGGRGGYAPSPSQCRIKVGRILNLTGWWQGSSIRSTAGSQFWPRHPPYNIYSVNDDRMPWDSSHSSSTVPDGGPRMKMEPRWKASWTVRMSTLIPGPSHSSRETRFLHKRCILEGSRGDSISNFLWNPDPDHNDHDRVTIEFRNRMLHFKWNLMVLLPALM